ncbi:MAG: L,D-transpeptidase [Candidatus Nanopelagicales bacterium]
MSVPETTNGLRRLVASFAAACALTILADPAAHAVDSTTPNSTPTTPSTPAAVTTPALQRKLAALKLPVGPATGNQGAQTRRALCVWRELTGRRATRLPATATEASSLMATPNTTKWKVPSAIKTVRFAVNMQCQTALFITKGVVDRIIPVSTGKNPGWTRRGLFKVYWIYPRVWQASTMFPEPDGRPGLYRPIYFDGNIAVHGTRHILRPRPQSHGCVRTQKSDQRWIAKHLARGMKVWVYGDYWKSSVKPFGLKSATAAPKVTTKRATGRSLSNTPTPIG